MQKASAIENFYDRDGTPRFSQKFKVVKICKQHHEETYEASFPPTQPLLEGKKKSIPFM
jgi:hypothetical protein